MTSSMARNDGKVFEEKIVALAQALGWHVAHFRNVLVQRKDGSTFYATPAAANGKGFPDLVIVRDRVIFAELKSGSGRLSPEQKQWREWLEESGSEYYVWTDRDVTEIKRLLSRRRTDV